MTFKWTDQHEQDFNKLKEKITSVPILKFVDINKEVTIEMDASKDGIGCCLLQDGHPVLFASRAMTIAEQKYAQIEKELFAVVFATDKFYHFICGKKFIVESDHKPLTSIIKKDLNKDSPRLQHMLLKLLKFEFDIKYLPGKDMLIADSLSRSYLTDPVFDDPELSYVIHTLSRKLTISSEKRKIFQTETSKDEILLQIIKFFRDGDWPSWNKIKSEEIKSFYKVKDELFLSDNLLFLNHKLIIPKSLQKYILNLLHVGHFGEEKSLLKARANFYWPKMCNDVKALVSACYQCQKYRKSNCREPLQPYPVPERPWQRISADLFHQAGKDYLAVIDSYTNWMEMAELKYKTAREVIKVFKSIFERLGIPEELISDNNPFTSREFHQFADEYGFKHTPSSSKYPKKKLYLFVRIF